MTWGDKIRLQSEDTEYIYRVEKVYQTKASEAVVPATPGKARLTLATCDSFKTKDDRFVVEAVLIDTKPL
jgi:LPXTG-site transpeptidase (sortase) family protein